MTFYGPGEQIPDKWFVMGRRRCQSGDHYKFVIIKMPWFAKVWAINIDGYILRCPKIMIRWNVM